MAENLDANLIGSFELLSWLIHYSGGQEPAKPFGSNPTGLLQYLPDGSMSATVRRSDRVPFPPGASPRHLDSEIIADAFRGYFHYAGTYRIEGDNVIHSIIHSLNQAMVGTEQVRGLKYDPPVLTLTGVEPFRDKTRRHELVWRRVTFS